MKVMCKYCRKLDKEEKMHKDERTNEYYHEGCRPLVKSDKVNWSRE